MSYDEFTLFIINLQQSWLSVQGGPCYTNEIFLVFFFFIESFSSVSFLFCVLKLVEMVAKYFMQMIFLKGAPGNFM